MKRIYRFGELWSLFAGGGSAYVFLEMLWRGYSHWTMFLTGGFCVVFVCEMDRKLGDQTHFLAKCIYGAAIITAIEFVVGCTVNLWLRWDVWDYSNVPLNLMGQICLPFAMAWLLLSIPVMGSGALVRRIWVER